MSTTAASLLVQAPVDYTWVVVVLVFFAVLLVGVIGMAVLAERSRRRARGPGAVDQDARGRPGRDTDQPNPPR